MEHLQDHNHGACAGSSRTFSCKDHLVQHMCVARRLKKGSRYFDLASTIALFMVSLRFCAQILNNWKEHTTHLTAHFRKGALLGDWDGDHGYQPWIAEKVRNSPLGL